MGAATQRGSCWSPPSAWSPHSPWRSWPRCSTSPRLRAIFRRSIPRILKEATVAIEDQRFYQTGAIDLPSIIRAALADLVTGRTVQGGSTIAMQLADNLYLGHQQTFERKVKEAVIAERLSNKMSKREILADYLNTVPYGTVGGQTAYGAQAAARMAMAGRSVRPRSTTRSATHRRRVIAATRC